jgi:hypothetical protein
VTKKSSSKNSADVAVERRRKAPSKIPAEKQVEAHHKTATAAEKPKTTAKKSDVTPRKSPTKIAAAHPNAAPKITSANVGELNINTTPKLTNQKSHDETAPKRASEEAVGEQFSPKVVTNRASSTHPKNAVAVAPEKASNTQAKAKPKAATGKPKNPHATAPKLPAETASDVDVAIAKTSEQFERFRDTQVPDSMRTLAERNVAQTRQLYERSKNAFDAIVDSWEKSFGGAVALNRKIIEIAEQNLASGFDLATGLAGARNLAEVAEMQMAFWRKQFSDLNSKAEEVRLLSIKMTTDLVQPLDVQLTRRTDSE